MKDAVDQMMKVLEHVDVQHFVLQEINPGHNKLFGLNVLDQRPVADELDQDHHVKRFIGHLNNVLQNLVDRLQSVLHLRIGVRRQFGHLVEDVVEQRQTAGVRELQNVEQCLACVESGGGKELGD